MGFSFKNWLLGLLALCAFTDAWADKNNSALKVSMSQYRVEGSAQESYWLQSVSGQYQYSNYKIRLSQPYIQSQDDKGIGNGLLKLSKLGGVGDTYVDVHLKRKLANANQSVTLPISDTGASIELSRMISGVLGFVEVGYWWRERTEYNRKNNWFYSLGLVSRVSSSLLSGVYLDQKPTAYGEMDRSLSSFLQIKVDRQHKLSLTLGKGLEDDSPAWLAGLQWSFKIKNF